ncbi:RIMS-binding protein 2-like isoform X4 [Branchiostoma lanceolatum]|uniref:RIMS-binding protein 2-like isoform X4 n=1 Tax=Branchiostoma lanceolatum TaxID=7740 RepID=UPI003452BF57
MNQGAMRLDREPARYNRTSATAMSRERRRGGRTAGMSTEVERQLAALQGEVATLKKDKGRMEQLLYRKAVDDATRSPSPHDAGDGNKWEKWAWRQRHQKGEESPRQGEGQSSPSRQSFTAKHQAMSGSSSLNGSTQDLDTLEDSSEGRERLLAKKNRELTWTIRQLEKRCSALKTENVTLKRQHEELELAEDKISKLQRRNTELTTLARRLETKAKTLQQLSTGKSNQPTGENLEHYKRVFARQRAKDLADHAQAILAKDKEIGHLQQELTVLQGQGQNGGLYSHEEELQHIITQAAKEQLQMERTVCSRLAQNGDLEADRFDGGDERVQNLQLQVETLSQAAGRVQELEASLQTEKTSQQSLKEELRQANRRLSALEVELSEEKVSRAQLEEQLSNSNQRCSYLESELESQVVDNTDLTKRTSELQRQVSQLKQTQFESQGVHDQLNLLLIQNEELQTAKRAQENKVQHLQTVTQELEEELRQNPTEDLAATKHLLEEKEKTVQELLKHQKETEDSHRQTLHQLQARLQELDSQHADGQLLCQRQSEQLKELSEKLAKKSDVLPEHSAPSVSAASVGIQVNIRTGTQKSVQTDAQTDTRTDAPRSERTDVQKSSREAGREKRVNQIVKPVPIVGANRSSAFETVSPAAGVNGTPEPPPVVVAAPAKRTISPPVNHQSLAKELSSAGFHPIQEPDGSGDSWDEASTYTLPSHHDNDNPSPEPEPEPQSHTQQGLNGLEEASGDADMDKQVSEGSETAPTASSEAAHDRKKLAVYIARYSYNPYDGPNDNPEAELSFQAGEYVYVYGDMDEDMFFQGELMDGSRGLVPSNFVERVADEDMPNWSPAQPSISDEDATHVSFQSEDEVSISQLVPDGSTNDNQPGTTALQLAPTLPDSFTDTLDSLQKPDASPNKTPVPWPQNLTVDKQLTNSLILKWDPADLPAEEVLHYAVYLNRELKAKVPPDTKPSALIEGVDIEKTYRVCVRTTTRTGQSLDPQATLLVGKDATLAPSNLQVSEVTPTSCELSWLPSNSSYAHSLVVNNGEPKILAPGVYKHSITGLQPGTLQKVEVRSEKSSTSLWDFIESKTWKRNENTSASVQFETLPGGPPDPPVNVTVEPGQEPHQVLISWLPVTIDTTGTSNGAVVQGYAVYSGQRKVAEVSEPTGDSVVVEASTLAGTTVGPILVRTVSSSGDSINSQSAVIPLSLKKMLYQRKHLPTLSSSQVITEEMPEKPTVRRESGKIQSIEMMYEGRTDDSSPESDISDEQVEQFEPSVGRTVTKSPQDGLPMPPGGLDRELQEKKPEIRPSFRSEVHSDSSNHSELSDIAEEAEEDLEEEVHSDSMSIDVPGLDHPAQPVHLTAKLSHPTSEDPGANTESDLEEPPLPSTKVKQGRRASPTQHWRDQRRGHASPVPDTELPEEDDYSSGGESDVTLRDSMEGDRSAPRWFVALFDYDPMTMSPNPDAADEELPFREGQLIKVYGEKDGDGFFMGDVEGRCGVVPCNLVEEIEDDYRLQQLRNSNNVLSPDKLDSLPGGYQRDDAHIQNGHLSQLQSPVRRMRALFDYDPQEMSPNVDTEMELPFYQGDIIDVVGEMDEDGFFMGEMEGRRGLVPSNFLEDITTSDQADNYAPQPTGHDRSYRSPSHIQDRDISPQADRREAQPPKKKKGLLSKGKKLFKKLGGSVEGKSKR